MSASKPPEADRSHDITQAALSDYQRSELERNFQLSNHPSDLVMSELSEDLDLSHFVINEWYQNRNMRFDNELEGSRKVGNGKGEGKQATKQKGEGKRTNSGKGKGKGKGKRTHDDN